MGPVGVSVMDGGEFEEGLGPVGVSVPDGGGFGEGLGPGGISVLDGRGYGEDQCFSFSVRSSSELLSPLSQAQWSTFPSPSPLFLFLFVLLPLAPPLPSPPSPASPRPAPFPPTRSSVMDGGGCGKGLGPVGVSVPNGGGY